LKIQIPQFNIILPLLAVAAGIAILITTEKPSGTIGLSLLGIYLLAKGLLPFLKFKIPGSTIAVFLMILSPPPTVVPIPLSLITPTGKGEIDS